MISVQAQIQQPAPPALREGSRNVRYGDWNYPSNLDDAAAITMALWYRGTLKPSDKVAVAVIGSRRCSEAGQKRAFKLGYQLAQEGVTVVSGLALGADAATHRGALAAGGRTFAVMGTGINHVYPVVHEDLAEEIESSGALFSQFLPAFPGSGRSFVKRNHVIAALSQVLIAVEGAPRSGSSAAVRAAIGQGRPVGLLRSLVDSQDWARQLVESGQAFPVKSLDDVMGRLSF